jgi:hypothetical protein
MGMEGVSGSVSPVARLSGNLGLLAAIFACLALWGGIVLLLDCSSTSGSLTPIEGPALTGPPARWGGMSETRRSLAGLLLFWLPIGLGTLACGAGVATLACGRGRDPQAARRALIALLLSAVPGCLCTLWYLVFSVSPYVGR